MSYTSGFFDAIDQGGGDYDRVYSAATFAHYFSLLVKNGVFPDPSTGLQVRASSSPDMKVSVSPGSGWINGYYITVPDNSPEVLTVPTANPSLSRYDSVIMGLNFVDREIQLYIKSGAVSASPSAVTLQRDSDLYELELARILVGAGVASITQAVITDTRSDSTRCGIVAGMIDQIDTTDLFAQYDDAFQTWFDDIQSQLSGDVATNLQNQINSLKTKTDATNAAVQALEDSKQDLNRLNGYLKIVATYASTGAAASGVQFTGLTSVEDETLLVTGEDGVFFGEVPVSEYTLVFRPILGEQAIPNKVVKISAGKVTVLELSLVAGSDTRAITTSGLLLVGLDCTEIKLFGVGGGGAGGAGGYASSYRGASAGGGGGYSTAVTLEAADYLGKFLTVTIGAGGSGAKSDKLTGNTGGATTVAAPDGTILLTANGGVGGGGAYSGTTATGGSGTGKGASVTDVKTSGVTFNTSGIDGAYPFGDSRYPRVGGGGAACGRYSGNYDQYNSVAGAGGGGLNGAGQDGLGGGGGGKLTSGNHGNCYDGGSGALFVA